jgi:hypothetical protein
MLFLLRPPQVVMPFALSRDPQQLAYRDQQRAQAYSQTRRAPRPVVGEAAPARRNTVEQLTDLAELHRSGALSDAEFQAAKARVLEGAP